MLNELRKSLTRLLPALFLSAALVVPVSTANAATTVPYIGAAYGKNAAPGPLESAAGAKLAVHRTYWSRSSDGVPTAKADVAAGRIPWVSFKTNDTWTNSANGSQDAWAKNLAKQLGALPGPVWVAIHHEPERDEPNMQEWVRMQRHYAPMFKAYPNIKYTVIFTGWNEIYGGRPDITYDKLWPGDGVADMIGIDAYQSYGKKTSSGTQTTWTDITGYIKPTAAFAAAHHAQWGFAETGFTDAAYKKDPLWLSKLFDLTVQYNGSAICYYDTDSPVANWNLESSAGKMKSFADILKRSRR
jgi:hypothetical protein